MNTLNPPRMLSYKNINENPSLGSNVRYCRTGGESMSIAIRLARAYNKREKSCFRYHGWHDWYLSVILKIKML